MKFELTNDQRIYFGLDPIDPKWDKVILKGDFYRPESVLYFEGNTIKKHIVSTASDYKEVKYNLVTGDRSTILPKTAKGKAKKLTAAVLETHGPDGVYCVLDTSGRIKIANFDTQITFYDSLWEGHKHLETKNIDESVKEFIKYSLPSHISEIAIFKRQKRKNVKFKVGDFFAFKIGRDEFGFGRVILNIDDLKKKKLITENHGLTFLMGKPVLVKIYAYLSNAKQINLKELENTGALPSSFMMDNQLFYGQFEIIGNMPLKENDFDFPISYGRHISFSRHKTFLQWGLIHLEVNVEKFNKFISADNPFVPLESPSRNIYNPYGFYSIGFYHGTLQKQK